MNVEASAGEVFRHDLKVFFQHCDPARILFYPHYFEMVNQTVEEWCERGLGSSFAMMDADGRRGVPTVKLDAAFLAPSRMGEILTWELFLTALGRASAEVRVTATVGDVPRMEATLVLVHVQMDEMRALPWPEAMRARMSAYLAAAA